MGVQEKVYTCQDKVYTCMLDQVLGLFADENNSKLGPSLQVGARNFVANGLGFKVFMIYEYHGLPMALTAI